MYFPSLSGTLRAVTVGLFVKKHSVLNDHHRIDRFGRLIQAFQESARRRARLCAESQTIIESL
jgi:hypothetical protein